jgi:hypothetical protein
MSNSPETEASTADPTAASPQAGDAPTDLHEPVEAEVVLAYSDAQPVAPVSAFRGWRAAVRGAGLLVCVGVLCAGVVVLVGHRFVVVGSSSRAVASSSAPSAPAAVTSSAPPTAAFWVPTATATVTVTPPAPAAVTVIPQAAPSMPAPAPAPPPRAPIRQGLQTASQDERFLSTMRRIGMIITDPAAAIAGAHNGCTFLAAGHSESEMVGEAMRNNPSMSPWQANAYVGSVVGIYCPEQAD